MFTRAAPLTVDEAQKRQLEALARAGSTPQKVARKCEAILLASQGMANYSIARQTGLSRPTVLAARSAFTRDGIKGLSQPQKRQRSRPALTRELEQKILDMTLNTRAPDATPWSVRGLARQLQVSRMRVHRVWQRHNLQPHGAKTFELSTDPKFEEKVRDVVGLYLDPPDRVLVLAVDQKSPIQASGQTAHLPLLRPGRPGTQTHDSNRHGASTLFAAFNILNGKVMGCDQPRLGGNEFVEFLGRLDKETPPNIELHLILDHNRKPHPAVAPRGLKGVSPTTPPRRSARHPSSSEEGSSEANSPPAAAGGLAPEAPGWFDTLTRIGGDFTLKPKQRRRLHFHFTPTRSSWIEQVEGWFGLITDRMTRDETSQGTQELERAIYQWLAQGNEPTLPFVWFRVVVP